MMINRSAFTARLVKILGKSRFCRLQSFAKVMQIKKNSPLYDNSLSNSKRIGGEQQRIVFIVDGSTHHGGLSDRLRGLFSVYAYCKTRELVFKVCWFSPFELSEYLLPSNVDWEIKPTDMHYDVRCVDVKFFNSYSRCNNDPETYFKLLKSSKSEVWVYSNVTLFENNYNNYFNELFTIEPKTTKVLDENFAAIGGVKYVSITFRFMNLLGDFQDNPMYSMKLNGNEREVYICKCLEAIKRVKNENPDIEKVLVTCDSAAFLEEAKRLAFVYVVPGRVAHMDETEDDSFLLHQKSFVDLLMLSRAEKVYFYSYGYMFGASKFAASAALIGKKDYVSYIENVVY